MDEIKTLKRLARKFGVSISNLPKPVRSIMLTNSERKAVNAMLTMHSTIVVSKHQLNGERKRRCRIYTVDRYLALKEALKGKVGRKRK